MSTVQVNPAPPPYATASLTRGYHSLTPPTAGVRQPLTPPTTALRGRRSLPASALTPPTLTSSWETFNDTDSSCPSPSDPGAVVAKQRPGVAKQRSADADCTVTADDVSVTFVTFLHGNK